MDCPGGPSVAALHGPGGPLMGGTIRSMKALMREEGVDGQHGKMGQYVIENDITCINRQ